MTTHGYWFKKIEGNGVTTYNYILSSDFSETKITLIKLEKNRINPNQWSVYLINLWDLELKYNGCASGTIHEVKKRIMLIFVDHIKSRNEFISKALEVLDK